MQTYARMDVKEHPQMNTALKCQVIYIINIYAIFWRY